MRQLNLNLIFRLFFFPSITLLSISTLCDCFQPEGRQIRPRSESNRPLRLASRQFTAPTTLDPLPSSGISSGREQPSLEYQNSPTRAKSSAEDITASSAKDRYEACMHAVSSLEQNGEKLVVPFGSTIDTPESQPPSENPSGVSDSRPFAPQGSSEASTVSGSMLGSSSQVSSSESTKSPQTSPIAKENLPPSVILPSSVVSLPSSNISSSALPSPTKISVNSNPSGSNMSSSPDKPSPSIRSQNSQRSYTTSADQKKIVIAGCVTLGMLLIMGTLIVSLRRKRTKNELKSLKGGSEEPGILRSKPGEFGKRGTVLAGRGLESRYGLPNSGGWLDTRVASTERLVSVFSSRTSSVDVRQTTKNPV